MKQPKSQSTMRGKLTKRLVLPSVRNSKTQAKLQEMEFIDKTQIFINVKLLPLDILLKKGTGSSVKILISPTEISVYHQNSEMLKEDRSFNEKEWLHINFGDIYTAKIRKIGDQNAFGKNLISADIHSFRNFITHTFDLKEILEKQKSNKSLPDDKSKEIKKFINTLMNKKISQRRSQQKTAEITKNLSAKRGSGLLKNRLSGYSQTQLQSQFSKSRISAAMSGMNSFRKQLANESKFTKHSQKQTNISCEQSTFHGRTLIPSNISVDSEDYLKKKMKFDTQPYFQNTGSFRSSQVGSILNCQLSNLKCQQTNLNTLQNKSLHKSQEQQVEEQIKRSGLSASGNQFELENKRQKKAVEQSSSCCESEELESNEVQKNNIQFSGTLYESKYQ